MARNKQPSPTSSAKSKPGRRQKNSSPDTSVEKAQQEPKRPGRPSKLTPELAENLFEHLASGKSLVAWCKQSDTADYKTVLRWLRTDTEFALNYARAREEQTEYFVDQMPTIAEIDSDPQRARLRIDTLKWIAGRMKPKKYGDKFLQEHSGPDGKPIEINDGAPDKVALARSIIHLIKDSQPPKE